MRSALPDAFLYFVTVLVKMPYLMQYFKQEPLCQDSFNHSLKIKLNIFSNLLTGSTSSILCRFTESIYCWKVKIHLLVRRRIQRQKSSSRTGLSATALLFLAAYVYRLNLKFWHFPFGYILSVFLFRKFRKYELQDHV